MLLKLVSPDVKAEMNAVLLQSFRVIVNGKMLGHLFLPPVRLRVYNI
jgi:hypothetical protein